LPRLTAVSVDGKYSLYRQLDPPREIIVHHEAMSGETFASGGWAPDWNERNPLLVPQEAYRVAHQVAACADVTLLSQNISDLSTSMDAESIRHMQYQVPRSARVSVQRGAAWAAERGVGAKTLIAAGSAIASGGALDLPAVQHICDCLQHLSAKHGHKEGFSPNSPGYPSTARVTFECLGGEQGLVWARRIVENSAMTAAGTEAPPEEDEFPRGDVGEEEGPPLSPEVADEITSAYALPEEEVLEGEPIYRVYPGEPHYFWIGEVNGLFCEVCGSPRSSLIHIIADGWPDDMEPFDEFTGLEDEDEEAGAPAPIAASGMEAVDRFVRSFHAFRETDGAEDDAILPTVEHWFEPDPIDGGIARVYAYPRSEMSWKVWTPAKREWSDSGDPDDAALPLDESSAYRSAMLLSAPGAPESISTAEIDESESILAESAREDWDREQEGWSPSPPVYSLMVGADGPTVVASPSDGEPPYWRWDTRLRDWTSSDHATGKPLSPREAGTVIAGDHWRPDSPMVAMALSHVDLLCGYHGDHAHGLTADGFYDSSERSANASQQVRDASGRFARVNSRVTAGGRTGRVTGVHPQDQSVTIQYDGGGTQRVSAKQVQPAKESFRHAPLQGVPGLAPGEVSAPKAQVPPGSAVLTPEQTNEVVSGYEDFVKKSRKASGNFAAITPDTSDVQPIYFAVVDAADRTAVLELLALAPASTTGGKIMAYIRTKNGWEPNETILRQLRSTNPPPVVVVKPDDLPGVMEQIDTYFAEQRAEDEKREARNKALGGSGLWDPHGALLPVVGGGGADRNRGNAERLRHYWTRGPGAMKIRWGMPGDWSRCYRHLSKYMGVRAKGWCQLRHKEVLGFYTSTHAKMHKDGVRASASPAVLVASGEHLLAVHPLTVDEYREVPRIADPADIEQGDEFAALYEGALVRVEVHDPADFSGWRGTPGELSISRTNLPLVRVDEGIFLEKD
jgi:hypothetical protein